MTWFTNRFLPLSISSASDIPISKFNSNFLALIIGWSLLWNYWIWSSFCIWSLMICSLLRAVWWWFGDENSSFMLQPTYLIFKSAAAPQLLVVVGSVLTFSGSSLSNSLGYALSRRNLHSNTKIHIASEPTYYSSKARGKIDKSKRKNTKYFAAELRISLISFWAALQPFALHFRLHVNGMTWRNMRCPGKCPVLMELSEKCDMEWWCIGLETQTNFV